VSSVNLKGLEGQMFSPLGVWLIPLLLLNALFASAPLQQAETTFKVGAWGDDASRGNFGVEAKIQTHAYNTTENSFDYFWVGDDLSDGAFIQFGYSLEPGNHCLRGAVLGGTFACEGPSESISEADARWQWQYWPDRTKPDFYFGIGPSASAGPNATAHEYSIRVSPSSTWTFTFDGGTVEQTEFPASPSSDPALIVAEGSAGNSSQPLGPVRFDALSYFDDSQWKMTDSLIAASYCGISVGCVANEYGAVAIGPDSLVAGFGIPRSPDGTLLWTSEEERLLVQVHPGVQFFVTSVSGTQPYTGYADLSLPKGMFAYISLTDTDSSTPGVLGWLGAQDRFRGWVGTVDSSNLTTRILVDSNESVTAVWTTDVTVPTVIILAAVLFTVGITALFLANRKRRAGHGAPLLPPTFTTQTLRTRLHDSRNYPVVGWPRTRPRRLRGFRGFELRRLILVIVLLFPLSFIGPVYASRTTTFEFRPDCAIGRTERRRPYGSSMQDDPYR